MKHANAKIQNSQFELRRETLRTIAAGGVEPSPFVPPEAVIPYTTYGKVVNPGTVSIPRTV